MPDGENSVNTLPGTFAAYELAPRSAAILAAWAQEQGIPNPVPAAELHLTTVYSRAPVPAYNPNGLPGMLLLPDCFGLEMFGDALVLTVKADWLQENHAHAMRLGASHDFPTYRPHITLSYDAAGFDVTFSPPQFALRLGEERVEDLRKSLRAMADIARLEAAIEKAKGSQPRVPAGSPKGGQFTTSGTGMVSGVNAPQLGMVEGFNAATGNPYPMRGPRPTDPEHNGNPDDVAVWVKGYDPGQLDDGPRFERWTPPADWSRVEGQMPRLDADNPIQPVPGKSIGAGVIIREPDGRIWMVEPTNHYGGYRNTFPKGTQEEGLSLQANAIKEAYEESGLKVRITGLLGDYERTTSVARFYTAEREGGTPVGQGPESQAVKLVPLEAARELANMPIDHKILDDYSRMVEARVEKRAGWVQQAVNAILAKIKGSDGYNRWPAGSHKGGQFAPKGAGGGGGSGGKGGAGGGAAAASAAPTQPQGAFQPSLMTGKNPDNSALIAANKAIANYATLANKADIAGLAAIMPPDPSTQASGGNGYTKAKFAQWQAAMTHAIAQANKPVTANTGTDQTPMKLSTMKKVGEKPGGSAAGAVFQDADGQKWLVKSYNSSDQARNEVLAANLYKAAGIDAPEMRLVDVEGQFKGGVGVASKWEDEKLSKFDPKSAAQIDKAQEGFAVDAWLSNWDVVGLENDNLLSRPDGSLVRIDPGGALLYRAQGSLKGDKFGNTVGEWDSLRGIGPSANMKAAQAFAAITPAKMAASAERVTNLSDDKIRAIVAKYGPGDDAAKTALADKLIARKQDIAAKAAAIAPAKAPEIEPAVAAVHAAEKPAAAAPTIPSATAALGSTSPAEAAQMAAVFGTHPDSPEAMGAAAQAAIPIAPTYEGKTVNFYNMQSSKIDTALGKFNSMPPLYVPTTSQAYNSDNYAKYVNHYMKTVEYAAANGKAMEIPSILQTKQINIGGLEQVGLNKLVAEGDPAKIQAAVNLSNYAYVAAKLVEDGKGDTMIGDISAKQALAEAPDNDFFAQTGISDLIGKNAAMSLLNVHGNMVQAAKDTVMPAWKKEEATAAKIDAEYAELFGPSAGAAPKQPRATVAPVPEMPATPMPQGLKLPNYEAVKLPESNTNAGTFNAQVTKLAALAAAGDVKGILNSTYGTNTYGKKLATLANDTLWAMGHPAVIKAGMNTKADPAKGTYQTAAGWGGPKSTGLEAKDMAQAAPTPKAVAAANKPAFNPTTLMQPPSFTNWQGSGKGLSSSAPVNEANTAAAKSLYDIAVTGDEKALKAATFYVIDKATGLPTGEQKSFAQHPSNQVRQYYNALLEEIHEQKYAGQPFSVTAGGQPIDAYNKMYPAAVTPKGAAQMLGMYVVSGQTDGPPVVRGKVADLSAKFMQKAQADWYSKPAEARGIVQNYISTSGAKSMNTQLRAGKETITANGKTYKREQFKAMMGEVADVYPPGTKLYRRMSSGGGAGSSPLPKAEWNAMISEIKTAKPGQILTELGFTSTSHGSGVFSGELEWRFTTAPGFKAISLFTMNPGEKEVLLPPGTRYHIQGWKEVGGKLLVDAVLLPSV